MAGDFVVSTVSLSRKADGAEVQLELLRPGAFEPDTKPLPRRRKARASTNFAQGEDKWHLKDTTFYDQHPELADQADEGIEYDDTSVEPFG